MVMRTLVWVFAAVLALLPSCGMERRTLGPRQEPQSEAGSQRDAGLVVDAAICNAEDGLRLYDERIDPLFRDDHPSSCNQCHLNGIDLAQYVQGTPCETYACMLDEKLVNEQVPEQSKILSWIARAQPQSSLITKDVIEAEYSAFLEWITYNSRCQTCASVTCPLPSDAGTFCPDEGSDPHANADAGLDDPGGCASTTIESMFRNAIYRQRGRCAPCHIDLPENEQYESPLWIEVAPDCETGARLTLDNVLRHNYLDLQEPEKSLLLLKPLPEDLGGLPHGGGDKFDSKDDPGYQSFLRFIERLAECESSSSN